MTIKIDTAGNFVGVLQKPKATALANALKEPTKIYLKMLEDLSECIDIDVAHGAGLDLIGNIVGQSRDLSDAVYLQFFGYVGQNNATGYGKARYRQAGESSLGGTLRLADEEYRRLLRWRRDYIRSSGTTGDIKTAIANIFGSAKGVSVQRTGDAEITIDMPASFTSSSYIKIAQRFIPYPAGVSVKLKLGGKEI